MQRVTHSLEEFNALAHGFTTSLSPNTSGATVVALSGELGAGKTTFVQEVARALGIAESVTSPTFVIEKVYELSDQRFKRLIHIDVYRLKDAHELEVLGWVELAADPGNLILIEWPERVPELIPAEAIRLRFEIQDEGRIITSDGEGEENREPRTENSQ